MVTIKPWAEAIKKFPEILQQDPRNAEEWNQLGLAYYNQGDYQEALEVLYKALELNSSQASLHYSLGLVLEKIGYLPQAIQSCQQAIALSDSWIEPYEKLGQLLSEVGQFEKAEAIYRQAIALTPNSSNLYLNLGNILLAQQQFEASINIYEKALQFNPKDPEIWQNLGIVFRLKNELKKSFIYYGYSAYYRGEYESAIHYYSEIIPPIDQNLIDEHLYLALADCYIQTEQTKKAIEVYRQGINLYPQGTEIYLQLISALQNCGQTQEAIQIAEDGLMKLPNQVFLKLESARIIPIIYKNKQEIYFYRNRFSQKLIETIEQTSLINLVDTENALKAIGWRTNFYLQYQGYNDLELQTIYGNFVHQVMAINYPQWVDKLPLPSLGENEKIRIGYVSDCFHWHTVGMVFLGWIKNCDRQSFSIHCYYPNSLFDQVTEQFESSSDRFHDLPEDLEEICQQIRADNLHILIFLDIGMSPLMTQLAGLRLAPVQCAAWGHPVTTGLPTIDYFIGADLIEPANAQEHYSEELIRLPNLGICYPKPIIPEISKTRLDLGLHQNAVIYLSCQSLFKYLPQYDYIFAAIAQQIPDSQFVFVAHPSNDITQLFQQRLQHAFAKFRLKSEDYCIILPRQSHQDYWQLNQICDIFLDTFGFTGFLTTLDSIACGLPVVTCPGEVMRNRQSYGILQRIGVTETIAQDEAEYIKISVKLGLDRGWRDRIVEKIKLNSPALYNDNTCVTALEAFYRNVVAFG